jgi:hypothetical protein
MKKAFGPLIVDIPRIIRVIHWIRGFSKVIGEAGLSSRIDAGDAVRSRMHCDIPLAQACFIEN